MSRKYIVIALFIAWRTIQSTVVIPASIVAAVLLSLIVAGKAPVQEAVIGLHHWAETAVRPAPAGTILVTECTTPETTTSIKPPVLCDSTRPKIVPIDDAAKSVAGRLTTLYWMLVVMSVGVLLMVRPGRKFLGLNDPAHG